MSVSEPSYTAPPESGSEALRDFCIEHQKLQRLYAFVCEMATRGDFMQHRAAAVSDARESAETPDDLVRKRPGPAFRTLQHYRQDILELFFCRFIDNFENYLVSILRAVLHAKPEILSGSKQELAVGDILKFASIGGLIDDILERKLMSLSYQGFGDIEEWCRKQKIPLIVPAGRRDHVVEAIALRNIIVHNRGRVDERYIKASPGSTFHIGAKRTFSVEDLVNMLPLISEIAIRSDKQIVAKFKVSVVSVEDEVYSALQDPWSGAINITNSTPVDDAGPHPE